jgi:CBS domain-containing protein
MRRRTQGVTARSLAEGNVLDASCCVAEVMGTELFTLTPDTVVSSALRLAATKRIHHFLVIEDGNLTGIVCQADLRQARRETLVGECMSSPVLCIGPETTLKEAADIMEQNAVGCLPVVTGAFLVGVITQAKLERMGVAPEETADVLEEVEEVQQPPGSCAACGKSRQVQRHVRAGMMALCTDCASVMPTVDPPRAN